jgi:hypothetical protein
LAWKAFANNSGFNSTFPILSFDFPLLQSAINAGIKELEQSPTSWDFIYWIRYLRLLQLPPTRKLFYYATIDGLNNLALVMLPQIVRKDIPPYAKLELALFYADTPYSKLRAPKEAHEYALIDAGLELCDNADTARDGTLLVYRILRTSTHVTSFVSTLFYVVRLWFGS